MSSSSDDWFTSSELPKRIASASLTTLVVSALWCCVSTSLSLWYQNPLQPHLGLVTILYPSMSTLYLLVLASISLGTSLTLSGSYTVTSSKPKNLGSLISTTINPQIMLNLVISGILSLVTTICFTGLAWPQFSDDRYLMSCGLVTGVIHSFQHHVMSTTSTMVFPIIHKERSSQLSELINIWSKSLFQSIRILQYYVVTSFLFWGIMYQCFPCQLSLTLALATLVNTVFLTLVNNTRAAVFSIYLTSPLTELPQSELLQYTTSKSALLQTLALQSLSRQVTTNPSIRSHIFSLSQPGGHPTNWKTVSKVCMDTITSVFPKPSTPAPAPATPAVPITSSFANTPNMRRLGASNANGTKLQDVQPTPKLQLLTLFPSFDNMMNFGGSPDVGVNVRSMMLSLDIISQLVCTSLTEDTYGVVQRDLSDILTNIVKLDTELHMKKLQKEICNSGALKQAVKAGLYKIALKFGPHLNDISLPKNVAQKMNNFSKLLEV